MTLMMAKIVMVAIFLMLASPIRAQPLIVAYFICETEDQAYAVASNEDLIYGISSLPYGCRWIHEWGLPRQNANIVEIYRYVDRGDFVVWTAKLKLFDGREKFSAGVLSILTS